TPVVGFAKWTGTATIAARTTKGILSVTDRLNGRLSITRSATSNTAGKAATDSFPSKAKRNSRSEKRYQAIVPRCLYLRYARKQGSTNAAATRSLRFEIHATASTCAG